ncbi:hypothetical protein OUZ56_016940 [Daphnia magna]|uniref:Transposable element P transposase-like RNase H domain-containing protein n=1 Tax=Daphnia magna TaxID=35525 RepID=A0ABR0ARR5_9CRUS|nr:hypothetical protein OUZ56_016940 [Daphnia magna]
MSGYCQLWRQHQGSLRKGIADHALVFMFRPYEGDWVQPFTCFATKGAAKGEIRFELLTKAAFLLYNQVAIVKNFEGVPLSNNEKELGKEEESSESHAYGFQYYRGSAPQKTSSASCRYVSLRNSNEGLEDRHLKYDVTGEGDV